MANLEFKVIGIDDVTTDPTIRFVCATTDGTNLYIGSESTNSDCGVWKYQNNKWANITDNLKGLGFKSINSILYKKGSLYVGTGEDIVDASFTQAGKGQVWYNSGERWKNTNLADPYLVLIRSLLSVQSDIFAAGSVFNVWKYSNGSWSYAKNSAGSFDVFTFGWIDLETDGSNVYGTVSTFDKGDVSGVVKYDGSNWSSIAPGAGFGNSNNYYITKLCWYNNNLYAGTYNEIEGCEVWRYDGGTSWTQINTNGFGSSNNFNIVSMEVVDGNLVVSTENIFGSEIWAYNTVDSWVKQTISSDVVYLSYLIQTTNKHNYLIGKESLKFTPSTSATEYLSAHQRFFKNANYWPQGPLGAIPLGLDNYRFIGSNGRYSLVSEGPLSDPLQDVSMSPITSGYDVSTTTKSLPFPININVNLSSASLTIPVNPEALPGAFVERFNFDLESTNPYAAFPEFQPKLITTDPDKFAQAAPPGVTLPPGFIGNFFTYQSYYNALHMNLIPKGPHRGKVMMMNSYPIIGYASSIHPTEAWSFQGWTIYDPSPDAGTPEKPKFLNYMLPIGPSASFTGPLYTPGQIPVPIDDFVWPNLFCAGHNWTPSGDLIVAGGSRWGFEYAFGGISFADKKCFVWNPAASAGSWFNTPTASAITNQEHYVSAGSWTRAQDLQTYRWYPTVMCYPDVSTTNYNAHALIFGGESTQNDRNQIQYDTYEAFEISSNCTSANSGIRFIAEYDGPSDRQGSSFYVNTGGVSSIIWNDSFYFYPRTFILSGGEITFAGMTHKSSCLSSYVDYPENWNKDLGGSGPGSFNYFRLYSSAYRIPNIDGNSDKLTRCGGANNLLDPRAGEDPNTATTDILDASILNSSWSGGPMMMNERIDFNTVLLPDATVFAVGGFREIPDNISYRYNEETETYSQRVSITNLGDHHSWEQWTILSSVADASAVQDYINEQIEHGDHITHSHNKDYLIYEITPQESTSQNTDGAREYHIYPEVIDYNDENPQWTLYDWTNTVSWRDYHSAAIMLPDGRILVGGGEKRHTTDNWQLTGTNGIGYDFEIFYPKYLRPTQNELDTLPRPTGVGLSGATFNSHPEVDCHDLHYGQEYILSSNFIRADVTLDKVVFMAPGSVTHHSCYNQRYHEVPVIKESDTRLRFTMPSGIYQLPPGFYMVFAVTTQRVPAEAIWVRLIKV